MPPIWNSLCGLAVRLQHSTKNFDVRLKKPAYRSYKKGRVSPAFKRSYHSGNVR